MMLFYKQSYRLLIMMLGVGLVTAEAIGQDWREFANFKHYAEANEAVPTKSEDHFRVVFMGDSITAVWPMFAPHLFDNDKAINRGIGGQTTPQMLLRFKVDVLQLSPDAVVILAGTNDLAGNSGDATIEEIAENIFSMAELSDSAGVEVVICSLLPAIDYVWSPGREPAPKIQALNKKLQAYSEEKGHYFVNYYDLLVDDLGGLKVPDYTSATDLVHPNITAYRLMEEALMPTLASLAGDVNK
jgi:lysophospholipase L1-like esterase